MKRELSPKLQQLIESYRASLPGKRDEIAEARQAAEAAGWSGLELRAYYDLVHKLAGSSGSYGLRELSEIARVLDRQLSDCVAGECAYDAAAGNAAYEELMSAFDRARAQAA